jgi:hypothetical protein
VDWQQLASDAGLLREGHDLFIASEFLAPGAFALPESPVGPLIREGHWVVKRGDGDAKPLSFEVMSDDQIRTLYEKAPDA